MDTQISTPQEGQQLTKRQKREQQREQYEQQRMRSTQRRRGAAFVWWGVGVLALVGIVWAIIAASNPTEVTFDDNGDPFQGGENAAVVVREFSDFQCPACRSAEALVTAINDEFGDRIKFVYKDYPLTGIHDRAYIAAIAGQCAMPQNKFWAMHDKLFQNQSTWSNLDEAGAKAAFVQYASELGMNSSDFTTCLDAGDAKARVDQDIAEGNRIGINGTPTFYINDAVVQTSGLTLDMMKQKINAALDEAETANTNVSNSNTAATNETSNSNAE